MDRAILAWFNVRLPWEPLTQDATDPRSFLTPKSVGEACGGELLPKCQPVYGDKLYVACRNCEGMKHG